MYLVEEVLKDNKLSCLSDFSSVTRHKVVGVAREHHSKMSRTDSARQTFAVQSDGYSLRGEEGEERAASRGSTVSQNIWKGSSIKDVHS